MADRDLCRGWTASDIRALVAEATDKQYEFCERSQTNPHTTTEEMANRLGWSSHTNVRATLGALARTSHALGVRDASRELSWPFVIEHPPEDKRSGDTGCPMR